MTTNIRTAAQREASSVGFSLWETGFNRDECNAFVEGAVWGADRVTPTREQIAKLLYETCWGDLTTWEDDSELFYGYADAVLKLMQKLAEGNE